MIGPLEAHGIALLLVVLDLAARAARIRILTGAIGHPLSYRNALMANALGDAACAVTPMRLGGEPARLAGLLRAGIPATATFVAIAFEVVTMWPVIIASAVAIALAFAPGWFESAGPAFLAELGDLWSWLVFAAGVSALVWIFVRRAVKITPRVTRRPWRRVMVYGRRMPPGPLVAAAFLAFVNLACRTAILPVLMLTLPSPPPLGPAVLGSFALLYSQLVLPTPSGAGVVDLGFLAGAAGNVGAGDGALLFWWRFYTTFLGVGMGAYFAVREFGWSALRGVRGKNKA
jgi:uncharacterized membrane protein YbhN (UPF0104 family)